MLVADFWTALLVTLTAYDCWFTYKHVKPADELNPVVKWLMIHVPRKQISLAAIIIPSAAIISLSYLFKLPSLTAFACGVRSMLAWRQAYFLKFGR